MIGIRQSHYLVQNLILLRKAAKNISESGSDAVNKDLTGWGKKVQRAEIHPLGFATNQNEIVKGTLKLLHAWKDRK